MYDVLIATSHVPLVPKFLTFPKLSSFNFLWNYYTDKIVTLNNHLGLDGLGSPNPTLTLTL